MTTERQPAVAVMWQPPRGILFMERPGRPRPFLMSWRVDGARKAQAFETADLRRRAAEALVEKRAAYGHAITDFDPIKWVRFREAEKAADGHDLLLIVDEWKRLKIAALHATGDMRPPRSVRAAVTDYLAERFREQLSPDTVRHLKSHLEQRFAKRFGDSDITRISSDDVATWIHGLPFGPITRCHHLITVKTFFNRALQLDWIARNPCAVVKAPKVAPKDVAILPIADAIRLFAVNAAFPIVGRLALEAFGGLRYSSAARLTRDHLRFSSKGIEMPAALHKSSKRKYREGQPANLWAWLRAAPAACWDLTPRQILEEKGRAFLRAGIESPPHNVLRHSFASYHIAVHRNMSTTAYLMQHSRTTTTEIYLGVAQRKDGLRYFSIRPPR